MIAIQESETMSKGYSWKGVPCVFTDGGLMSSNPSVIGGTWAWVRIDEAGEVVQSTKGTVMPEHLRSRAVTNNQSEITAIYQALRNIPNGWSGRLYSDSEICINWINTGKWKNCLDWIRDRVIQENRRIRDSGGFVYFRHLDGHQEGSHFHQWNCKCDQMCNEARAEYEERNRIESRRPKPKRSKRPTTLSESGN